MIVKVSMLVILLVTQLTVEVRLQVCKTLLLRLLLLHVLLKPNKYIKNHFSYCKILSLYSLLASVTAKMLITLTYHQHLSCSKGLEIGNKSANLKSHQNKIFYNRYIGKGNFSGNSTLTIVHFSQPSNGYSFLNIIHCWNIYFYLKRK